MTGRELMVIIDEEGLLNVHKSQKNGKKNYTLSQTNIPSSTHNYIIHNYMHQVFIANMLSLVYTVGIY